MDTPDVSSWLNLLAQGTRFITLELDAADGLLVERCMGREAVNGDFRFTLDCLSASAFLDLPPLSGTLAHLGLATADGGRRNWHGYITRAASLGADGGLARYRLTLQSGLAFLETRRNTLIFQDQTALDAVTQVLADYPQLPVRTEVTTILRQRPICTQYRETDLAFVTRLLGEEGLSYRIEQQQGDTDDGPGCTLVIFDATASQSLPAGEPATIRFHRIDATEKTDAITHFAERREVVSNVVTTASWAEDQVQSVAGMAEAPTDADAPELPLLDLFEADRAQRFADAGQADAFATHHLEAARMLARSFAGQGSVRTLEPGKTYTLTEHPDLAGQAPSTGSGQAFVPLVVEHLATNNLGTHLPHLLGRGDDEDLGRGSYRNTFLAIPAGVPIAPTHHDRPLAPSHATALVVGVAGAALTGTRDHQVRVQFFWQRGTSPNAGGLTATGSSHNPDGHAPGDQHTGTWVRVAETNAGAHHGASFVPRIGTEVLIEYAHGDLDQPLVVGQLYNGHATPVFAAGEHSQANHPGTLSGIQTQTLDGNPSASWVLDDASGQLRHSVSHTLAASRLDTGYLIGQAGSQRGGYLGEGFALASAAWTMIRAGAGMLVSGTARPQGQSTQMDAAESIAQLQGAVQTARRLDSAASQATAMPLHANSAQADLQQPLDPTRQGKYPGAVNGQAATKPNGSSRSGGAPVERFAQPVLLMESPTRIAWTSPKDIAAFAGEHLHVTSQRDAHLASGATIALASGDSAGLYAADGGVQVIANHGPVSIAAHTDQMQVLADKDVTVTSTTDAINILAKHKIVIAAGQSSITLDGQNLTLACPGTFTVKTAQHQWLSGEGQAAELPKLPGAFIIRHDQPIYSQRIDGSEMSGYQDGWQTGAALQRATEAGQAFTELAGHADAMADRVFANDSKNQARHWIGNGDAGWQVEEYLLDNEMTPDQEGT